MSDLIISLSGIRGIVGKSFTEKEAHRATELFFKIYLKPKKQPQKIIIGQDIKPTGKTFLKTVTSALYQNKIEDIINLGITTLPIMQWAVKHFQASGGIFITASHNPIEYNGIKFISSYQDRASILSTSIMQKIKDAWDEKADSIKTNIKELPFETSCIDKYNKDVIEKIKKTIDLCSSKKNKGEEIFSKLRKKQLKIALDACSKEGFKIPKSFLMALGIEEKNIYPINMRALSECKRRLEPSPIYLTELKETVKKHNLDIGFAFDPDQDRLVAMPLRSEELVPLLCVKFLLELRQESKTKYIKQIAINLSTSSLWDKLASKYAVEIIRTRVGEFNVVEAMQKYNLPFGAEGNGGVILKEVSAGRNSTVGMALILAYMAWSNCSIKELEDKLPRRFMVKDKIKIPIPQENMLEFLDDKTNLFITRDKDNIKSIDKLDGYKIIFKDDSWIHIRSSNTEPIIRLIAESKSQKTANLLISQVKILLKC
jgi:phosphomannomutase